MARFLASLIVLFVLVNVYSYFFTNPFDSAREVTSGADSPYQITCKEPISPFTLGMKAIPTQLQKDDVCSCIWASLGDWEKEVSESYRNGREVSELMGRAFLGRFHQSVRSCNTEDL